MYIGHSDMQNIETDLNKMARNDLGKTKSKINIRSFVFLDY